MSDNLFLLTKEFSTFTIFTVSDKFGLVSSNKFCAFFLTHPSFPWFLFHLSHFFFFFSFLGCIYGIWQFPGQGLNQSCSCWPTPEPEQCLIQATHVCNLCRSSRQCWILNPLSEARESNPHPHSHQSGSLPEPQQELFTSLKVEGFPSFILFLLLFYSFLHPPFLLFFRSYPLKFIFQTLKSLQLIIIQASST